MKLTQQSKALISFLYENKQLHYHKPTIKTQHVLLDLYHQLKEAHHYVRNQLPSYAFSMKQVIRTSQISKPRNFSKSNFPEGVYRHIEQHTVSEVACVFSLFGREIKVIFMLEDGDSNRDSPASCRKYMEPVVMWLYILCQYASRDCVQSLTIYIYMTSLEKTLPRTNAVVLDETHVNTAFTTSCPSEAEIVVFRKEEWFKVLIHETFHCFGLDFSTMSSRPVDQCILSIFHVPSQVNAYEAYTEFWAEVINAAFGAFYSSRMDPSEFLSLFNINITLERTYSLFQLVKTLQFMGLTYNDLYSPTQSADAKRKMMYKENTNVLAYYVLKSILLYNYQSFMQWCKIHNTNILQFKKTAETLKQFCEFIRKHYKTPFLLRGIQQTQQFFHELSREEEQVKGTEKRDRKGKGKERGNHILSNMRMSIIELG